MGILVVHPRKLVGEALTAAIASAGTQTAKYCPNPQEVAEIVSGLSPSVAIISASYGEQICIDIMEKSRAVRSGVSFIVISSGSVSEEMRWVLPAGASGYLTMECSIAQVMDAITRIQAGEVVIGGVDQKALTTVPGSPAAGPTALDDSAFKTLTAREKEVLGLLSKGFSNRQIAEDLFLSEHTVRTHVQNLRGKLNVRSKFQAAMLAMQVSRPALEHHSAFRF